MKKYKLKGFTLVELMIALVIIAILAAIALPVYRSYITKARRADAQSALMDLAARMERYYVNNSHTYVGATVANLGVSATTTQGYYTLSVSGLTATTFTVTATPIGTQATSDTICAALSVNQTGQQFETGTGTVADCW